MAKASRIQSTLLLCWAQSAHCTIQRHLIQPQHLLAEQDKPDIHKAVMHSLQCHAHRAHPLRVSSAWLIQPHNLHTTTKDEGQCNVYKRQHKPSVQHYIQAPSLQRSKRTYTSSQLYTKQQELHIPKHLCHRRQQKPTITVNTYKPVCGHPAAQQDIPHQSCKSALACAGAV